MALKEEIRRNRKRLNMRQADLAVSLGVGIASIKRWELGCCEPSIKTLTNMSRLFGITETELLHSREEENEGSKNVL